MTIKVERDALLRVLSQTPFGEPCATSISLDNDDEFVLVDVPRGYCSEDCSVKLLRDPSYDDEESVCTVSTSSTSSDYTTSTDHERRVTFAEPLVTEEWTRPWTPKEDVPQLFYSTEETARFRQDYRLERKLITELALDPETFPVQTEELSSLFATTSNQSASRHRISRVVVLHDDKLETFFSPDEEQLISKSAPLGDDFFDNDSFWSGSITWY